ncbi:hypothetical protein EMIT0P100_180006 [Pseudomonas sp. IT-P100]
MSDDPQAVSESILTDVVHAN